MERIVPHKPMKLIRDKVIAKLKAGEVRHVLNEDDLNDLYMLKVLEELGEIEKSDFKDAMEFADILEAIYTLAARNGFDKEYLERAMFQKREKKGGFSNLVLVNMNPNNPSNRIYYYMYRGYLSKPNNPQTIQNICMSYQHDFGLLSENAQRTLVFQCEEWLRAIENTLNTVPHAGEDLFKDRSHLFNGGAPSDKIEAVDPPFGNAYERKTFLELCEKVAKEYENLDEGFYSDEHNHCIVKRVFPESEGDYTRTKNYPDQRGESDRYEVEISNKVKNTDFSFLYFILVWGFVKSMDTTRDDIEIDEITLMLTLPHPDFNWKQLADGFIEMITYAHKSEVYVKERGGKFLAAIESLTQKVVMHRDKKAEAEETAEQILDGYKAFTSGNMDQLKVIQNMIDSGIRKTFSTIKINVQDQDESIEDYKTVFADDLEQLDLKVQHYLTKGWKIYGGGFAVAEKMEVKGVASFPSLIPKYMQTMIKPKTEEVTAEDVSAEKLIQDDIKERSFGEASTEESAPHKTEDRKSENRQADIKTYEEPAKINSTAKSDDIDWNNVTVDLMFIASHPTLKDMLNVKLHNALRESGTDKKDITDVQRKEIHILKGVGKKTLDKLQEIQNYVLEKRGEKTSGATSGSNEPVTYKMLQQYQEAKQVQVSLDLWDTLVDMNITDDTDLRTIDREKFLTKRSGGEEELKELDELIDQISKLPF